MSLQSTNLVLLIDVGNSRIKWTLADLSQTHWHAMQLTDTVGNTPTGTNDLTIFSTKDVSAWQAALSAQLHNISLAAITISHVAGPSIHTQLQRCLQQLAPGITPHWLQAQANLDFLINGYDEPARLGCDRWAALCAAAWLLPGQAVLVGTFGTATTLDALLPATEGMRFIGGHILPGYQTMLASLHQNTAQLPLADGKPTDFGLNTNDAIMSGCVAAQLGAFMIQYMRLKQLHGSAPVCLLSGGGSSQAAPLIATTLAQWDKHTHAAINKTVQVWVHPNLVIEGLFVLAPRSIRSAS